MRRCTALSCGMLDHAAADQRVSGVRVALERALPLWSLLRLRSEGTTCEVRWVVSAFFVCYEASWR